MSAVVLALLACASQDPVEQLIDEYLRRFEAAVEVQVALSQLSARLAALGAAATNPIARRLAEDLRDGVASAAAPAFIDALSGRADALAPLQSAFRDATTSAAGRIELANALAQLDDTRSWREGILAVASAPGSRFDDRLRALSLLVAADDPQGKEILRGLLEALPAFSAVEQRGIVDTLARLNTPETRASLEGAMRDPQIAPEVRLAAAEALVRLGDTGRLAASRRIISELRPALGVEDPKVSVVDVPRRITPASTSRPVPEKRGDAEPWGVYKLALGGVALGVALLVIQYRRRN